MRSFDFPIRVARELLYDLRSNGVLVALKIAVLSLIGVAAYHALALSSGTSDAVPATVQLQQNYNLYTLRDTLYDPELYASFLSDDASVDSLAAFSNALSADKDIKLLSIYNQAIPLLDQRGGKRFRYGYGDEIGTSEPYRDPNGNTVVNVKALQMNQIGYSFYGLHVAEGSEPRWENVDLSCDRIPVVLGNDYRGLYGIGDILQGWLYLEEREFEIIGFLEDSSSIWYMGNPSFSIDSYIVIPYPPTMHQQAIGGETLYGIMASSYMNCDIAVPATWSTSDVLDRLDRISMNTGYASYSLIGIPNYRVQLRQMRALMERDVDLLIGLASAIGSAGIAGIIIIDSALFIRRKPIHRLIWTIGLPYPQHALATLKSWPTEYLGSTLLITSLVLASPDRNIKALILTFTALAGIGVIDAIAQSVATFRYCHRSQKGLAS